MLNRDDVDEELQRGFGLSIDGIEPLLRYRRRRRRNEIHGMLQVPVAGRGSGVDRALYRGGLQQAARQVALRPVPAHADDRVPGTGCRDDTAGVSRLLMARSAARRVSNHEATQVARWPPILRDALASLGLLRMRSVDGSTADVNDGCPAVPGLSNPATGRNFLRPCLRPNGR